MANLIDEQRLKTFIPDILKYEYLKAEQDKIDTYNTKQKQKKLWKWKHKLIFAYFFFYKKLKQDNKKDNIDFT